MGNERKAWVWDLIKTGVTVIAFVIGGSIATTWKISNKLSEIEEGITQNANDISRNKEVIEDNKTSIATNTNDIKNYHTKP